MAEPMAARVLSRLLLHDGHARNPTAVGHDLERGNVVRLGEVLKPVRLVRRQCQNPPIVQVQRIGDRAGNRLRLARLLAAIGNLMIGHRHRIEPILPDRNRFGQRTLAAVGTENGTAAAVQGHDRVVLLGRRVADLKMCANQTLGAKGAVKEHQPHEKPEPRLLATHSHAGQCLLGRRPPTAGRYAAVFE